MTRLAWCSVDPVRRKIDFYPKAICARIEAAFAEWQATPGGSTGECVLGSDFFNATLHFHPNGLNYQTTPGVSMGRSGFKQPGYRTVKRLIVPEGETTVQLFAKRVSGEWRFCEAATEAEHSFEEPVPTDNLVAAVGDASTPAASFRPWNGDDLSSMAWDLPVVVWQWCRGVPERNGNLLQLSDDWWCPYMQDINAQIEAAFQANNPNVNVDVIGRGYAIKFTPGSSFALQRDEERNKERTVRRVVKTVQELKASLERISHPPPSTIAELMANLPNDAIPHHFLCPILQEVMTDPVRTVDGHTYERAAIERWFLDHETAPLTNCVLSSKALTPHETLRAQINDFAAQHTGAVQQ